MKSPTPHRTGPSSSNTTASVRWFGHHQVDPEANVLIQNGSVMDLDSHSNTVASLTLVNGGTVTTGAGRLDLGGDFTTTTTNATATIAGRLHEGNDTPTFTVTGPEDGPGLVINT